MNEPQALRPVELLVRLGAEDAGEVLTLQRAAYVTQAQAHADLNLPPLRQSFADMAVELADPEVLALGWRRQDGRLLAAVRARVPTDDPRVAEIGRLTVVPDCQGRGLGTSLLAAVEEQLAVAVAVLRLFTGEHSAGNLRLYARLGYRVSHRQPSSAGYDLVHLTKDRQASG